jgi:integrase
LSARTVRYVHTILHGAFGAAERDGRLTVNPADKAVPPSAKEATAPEMRAWDDVQLRRFLDWSKDSGDKMRVAWSLLALTGMRRGEALALRWGDVDFDDATIAVRRAVTLVKTKGERLVVGTPKSGKARVIDVDPQALATLRAHRAELATISLTLAGKTPRCSARSTARFATRSGSASRSRTGSPGRASSSGLRLTPRSGCTT